MAHTWTYKDGKGIPLKLAQHRIELDTTIPSAHQAKYKINPNYATIIKQDIDKLLATRFIEFGRQNYMVVTHSMSTPKKWQAKNLYRFQKIKCNHKKRSIPITFHR